MADDPTLDGGNLPGPVIERMAMERPDAVYDVENDLSLVSFLAGDLREAVMRVPPEVQRYTEAELKATFDFTPSRVDHALRASFWREYDKACSLGRTRMTQASIYAGICSQVYFREVFLTQPERVAWLVLPQQVYVKEMEAILHRCTQRLWDLVDMDIVDKKTGKVDVRRGELLLKVVQEVKNRVKGMAVQRMEKKSLSVKVEAPSNKAIPAESMDDLKRRLAQLEEPKPQALQAVPLTEAVDDGSEIIVVTPTRVHQDAE